MNLRRNGVKLGISCVLLALGAAAVAAAAERGTQDEAKAMLAKAVDHYKSVGRKQALADFTAKKAPFGDRDLYVACVAKDHTVVANGGYPMYVGTSADAIKDLDGKPLGETAWDAVAKTGDGAVEYRLPNPVTHKVEHKTTFFHRMEPDLLCGVGAFRAE